MPEPPDNEHNAAVGVDPRLQLQTRVAWYYYVANLTQQQIADRLGTSRVRVNRLLAGCRDSGVVQVNINSGLSDCVAYEYALVRAYGLADAVVVPAPDDEHGVRRSLGVGAGRYLREALGSGQTLALGWGRTLVDTLRATRVDSGRGLTVASMLGGLSHCARLNTFEIASDFARRLQGRCYYLPAPIYASSRAARDVLLAQDAIRATCTTARAADIAVLTAGDTDESLIVEYGLTPGERDALVVAGAVGDLLGHFIDADGVELDHELNQRTVAIELADLRAIANVVLVSGGAHKVAVTAAALRGGYANVLITDETSASKLLGAAAPQRA